MPLELYELYSIVREMSKPRRPGGGLKDRRYCCFRTKRERDAMHPDSAITFSNRWQKHRPKFA